MLFRHARVLDKGGLNSLSLVELARSAVFCYLLGGMGGLLSAMGVRHVLSKGVAGYTRPLEPMLCDALMKRINPTAARMAKKPRFIKAKSSGC